MSLERDTAVSHGQAGGGRPRVCSGSEGPRYTGRRVLALRCQDKADSPSGGRAPCGGHFLWTPRLQRAPGAPSSEVSHGCATRAELSESSLRPTCAPGPPGQPTSFCTHTLGQGQEQRQMVPKSCSCTPGLAVRATHAWEPGRAAGGAFPRAQLWDLRHLRSQRTRPHPQTLYPRS